MKDKLIIVATIALSSLLTACSTAPRRNIDTSNLSQLQSITAAPPVRTVSAGGSSDSQIRYKALEDIGMGLGAQGGLAAASRGIDANLLHDHMQLEGLFNFNGMMLSHGVLPPVLVEGDNSLNQADPDTIRVADKTYKILKQARFVTTPPNWREYLWQSFEKPEMPNVTLLPTNEAERRIWRHAVRVGWEKGTQQAYNIFQQNLALLKRDFQGMILYRKLLAENMISAPYVAKTDLGVTGNGDDMRINDQVLRITDHPQLQTNSNRWRAIVVKQDDN
jgi:defect-in-organelle-trafficking protein DotC